MSGLPMYVVEAFTQGPGQPFTGNLAGVCVLDHDDQISDELKQKIAAQLNVPVTAFIAKLDDDRDGDGIIKNQSTWSIRWFTPTVEAPLCGHATFASAFVIFNRLMAREPEPTKSAHTNRITFESRKGELTASIDWDTDIRLISLGFPICRPVPLNTVKFAKGSGPELWGDELMKATLGLGVRAPSSMVDDVQFVPERGYLLYRLQSTGNPDLNMELLRTVRPDFQKMGAIDFGGTYIHSVNVTVQGHEWNELDSRGKGRPQFYSRHFVPWAGINEDPVTGSAHTMLAPYWARELRKQGQNNENGNKGIGIRIRGQQLSARGGQILCTITGLGSGDIDSEEGGIVTLTGHGRLSMEGEFFI